MVFGPRFEPEILGLRSRSTDHSIRIIGLGVFDWDAPENIEIVRNAMLWRPETLVILLFYDFISTSELM